MVVFVPIATMNSLVGRFMAPFAMVMVVATIISLFVSFTLTPILAMTLLKSDKRKPNFLDRTFFKLWDKGYDYISEKFTRSIIWTRRYSTLIILGTLAISFLIAVLVMPQVGSDFFPKNDRGQFSIKIEYPSDYNLATAIKRTLELSDSLRTKLKGTVLHTSSVIGKVAGRTGQVTEGVYLAEINVITTQKTEREADLAALQELFRIELAALQNCIATQSIPSDVGAGGADIQAFITGPDLQVLESMGKASEGIVQKGGYVTDLDGSVRARKKMLSVLPKRGVLKDLGLNAKSMGSMLRGAFEGLEVGTYRIGARSFDVRIKNVEEQGLDQVENLTLSAIDGKPLNINVTSEILPETVSVSINRSDKERVAWLYGNSAPGVSLGEAINAMNQNISAVLPDGYRLKFAGVVEKMQEAQVQFVE
ncbi:MAG: efflux RND transporter permease subunit, partial [Victivallaceae bacterium]